jgi:hypothetical protein
MIAAGLLCGTVYAGDDRHDRHDRHGKDRHETRILVLSNRADLISGGNALVEIVLPEKRGKGKKPSVSRVELDGENVTSAFALRSDGRFYGLVTGLRDGRNVLKAHVTGGPDAWITITNHPIGGPVFSGGHQLAPWICARTTATPVTVTAPKDSTLSGTANTRASGLSTDPFDEQCNTATDYLYYYQPKATEGTACTFTITGANPCFVPYSAIDDPSTRPADADIADFTNDRGDTVKSLIRVEKGTLNRSLYSLVTFYDPAQLSGPWAPQKGWNGKVMWKMGAATSANRFESAANPNFDANALPRGFMVATSTHTQHSQNNNELLSAETIMMVREHIIETYGEIRYTMSDGGSGGSMMQTTPATVMPGLLNGLITTVSYPDAVSTWIETKDCGLLNNYYSTPQGAPLSTAQRTAVNGHVSSGYCTSWVNSFLPQFLPTNTNNCGFGFPASIVYDPTLRPNGVRCDTDGGPQEPQWGTFVDVDGNTKTKLPYDNVGVQYGLKTLQEGVISPEEFVGLNETIGSYNNDRVWSGGSTSSPTIPAPRVVAQVDVLPTIYKSGILADGKQLAKVAIIDVRAHSNNPDIHMPWRSWSTRDRLNRANGHHGNHVIRLHFGSAGSATSLAFATMDRWLAAVESDTSKTPLEQKIVNNKPADYGDACFNSATGPDVGFESPECLIKNTRSPHIVAGGPQAENIFKCQLKPLNFSDLDYNGAIFDASQQARLMAVFPGGVCDWTRRGIGQTDARATTFKNGPGGERLRSAPVSHDIGHGHGHGHGHHHDRDDHHERH